MTIKSSAPTAKALRGKKTLTLATDMKTSQLDYDALTGVPCTTTTTSTSVPGHDSIISNYRYNHGNQIIQNCMYPCRYRKVC